MQPDEVIRPQHDGTDISVQNPHAGQDEIQDPLPFFGVRLLPPLSEIFQQAMRFRQLILRDRLQLRQLHFQLFPPLEVFILLNEPHVPPKIQALNEVLNFLNAFFEMLLP